MSLPSVIINSIYQVSPMQPLKAIPVCRALSKLRVVSRHNRVENLRCGDGQRPFGKPALDVSQEEAKWDEWEVVAGVDGGNKELQKALEDTVSRNGIPCGMQGPLAYDVLVPRTLFYKAKSVLDDSPELKRRLLGVMDHPK